MTRQRARDEALDLELLLVRLEAFLGELEPYLISREVFWASDAREARRDPSRPRMTVGNLLLLLDQLTGGESDLSPSQRSRWRRCQDAWQAALLTWRSALERKSEAELATRLRLWKAYLEDVEQGDQDRASFATEVRNRVLAGRLVETLVPASEREPAVHELDALDRRLRVFFESGEFCWPTGLKAIYPRDRFWFLYGVPRARRAATGG